LKILFKKCWKATSYLATSAEQRHLPTVWGRPILHKREVDKSPVASDTTADIFSY